MSLGHPILSVTAVVLIVGFPWLVGARLGSRFTLRPWVLEAVPVLTLLGLVFTAYWPLAQGVAPTSGDHGFHLLKLVEALQQLRAGRLFGWTDLEFAGLPHNANYPAGGNLVGALLYALPGVDLVRAYAWSVLLQEIAVVGSLYLVGRLHYGRLTGMLAGCMGLCDRGDWWVGGYFSSVEVGMWVQALACSLLLAGLALWAWSASPSRWRLSIIGGALVGIGTVCHPQAALMAVLAAIPMAFALLSSPQVRLRDAARASALVAAGAACTSAWWFVPYLAKHTFSNPPSFPSLSSEDLWRQLIDGSLLHVSPMWFGAGLVGMLLFARRRDPFSRFIVLVVPAVAVLKCADALRMLHPSDPGFADTLQLTRVYFLLRPLGILSVAYAVSSAASAALLANSSSSLTRRGLPARVLVAVTVAMAVSLPGAAIPGWPTDPTPQSLTAEDRHDVEDALDRATQLMRPGERLALRHHDAGNHSLVFPAAERQVKLEVIGWDAAVMFNGRFSTESVELLGRIGCSALLSVGELPEQLKSLPLVGEFGRYQVRSIPRLPRAWMIGPGSVEVLSWSDDEVRLRTRDAGATSQLALGLAYYDAWFTDAGEPTSPFRFHEPTLSQIPARNGDTVIRYRTPTSQWVGFAVSLLGLIALALATGLAGRAPGQAWRFPRHLGWLVALLATGLSSLLVGAAVLPVDLAARATWRASSAFAPDHWATVGWAREHGAYDLMFHTEAQDDPWLILDLQGEHAVHQVVVTNRRDCCGERAIPLRIEVSVDGKAWASVAARTEPFESWTANFASVRSRYVRLRVPRRTTFHLARIEVY